MRHCVHHCNTTWCQSWHLFQGEAVPSGLDNQRMNAMLADEPLHISQQHQLIDLDFFGSQQLLILRLAFQASGRRSNAVWQCNTQLFEIWFWKWIALKNKVIMMIQHMQTNLMMQSCLPVNDSWSRIVHGPWLPAMFLKQNRQQLNVLMNFLASFVWFLFLHFHVSDKVCHWFFILAAFCTCFLWNGSDTWCFDSWQDFPDNGKILMWAEWSPTSASWAWL